MNFNVFKGEHLFTKFTWNLIIVVLFRDQSEEREHHPWWDRVERRLPRQFKYVLPVIFNASFLEKKRVTLKICRTHHVLLYTNATSPTSTFERR